MKVNWPYLRDNYFDFDDDDGYYKSYQSKDGIAIMIKDEDGMYQESIYVQEIFGEDDDDWKGVVFHPTNMDEPIARCDLDGEIDAKLYREESFLA